MLPLTHLSDFRLLNWICCARTPLKKKNSLLMWMTKRKVSDSHIRESKSWLTEQKMCLWNKQYFIVTWIMKYKSPNRTITEGKNGWALLLLTAHAFSNNNNKNWQHISWQVKRIEYYSIAHEYCYKTQWHMTYPIIFQCGTYCDIQRKFIAKNHKLSAKKGLSAALFFMMVPLQTVRIEPK